MGNVVFAFLLETSKLLNFYQVFYMDGKQKVEIPCSETCGRLH